MENNDKAGVERRKYLRIPTNDILKYKSFNVADDLGFNDIHGKIQAQIKNLSVGGVLFESDKNFEIGSLLKLEMKISGWEKFKSEFYKEDISFHSQPLVVLASVVRVEALEIDKKFDIGVCFAAIDDGHRWAMIKYIDRIQADEKNKSVS